MHLRHFVNDEIYTFFIVVMKLNEQRIRPLK